MKLMVISDRHRYLPPEALEKMKSELVMVMSKYFSIDPNQTECIIEARENRMAYINTIAPLINNNNHEPIKRRGRPRKSRRNLSSSLN
jgi:septum formation topological specificity factor MinE